MKRSFFYYILTISFLLFVWEITSLNCPSWTFVFPPPSRIVCSATHSLPLLLHHSWYTVKGILGGFFLAFILSISLATTMLSYKPARSFLQPLFVVLQCIPMFTLAPLIVLWFGWGLNAVIIPTALTVFFPLTLTMYQGIKSTPQNLIEQFVLHGATKLQIFLKLRVPYALPHIFSGLKIAIGSAGFAAIAGEWVASQSGLGILILESRRNYDMELTFAGLATLTIVTLLLFQSVLLIEKLVFTLFRIEKKIYRIKKHKKKYISILLPIIFLCLIPIGKIGKRGATHQVDSQNLTSLSLLLDWSPNPNHVPLYVGIHQHFFEQEGIDLYIKKNTDTGSVIPHVLFEQVDLTLYHALGIMKTIAKGAPIQIVGRLIDTSLQGFIYRQEDNISNFRDLNNKILGFCLNSSRDLTSLLETLSRHGVTPSKVRNVSCDLISPMILKKIDFLYGAFYNIEGVKISNLGVPVGHFLSDAYGLPTGPQLLLCGKSNTKATSKKIISSIRRALQNSIDFCLQEPELAFQIYLEATKDIPKLIEDEKKQWKATLPLLAKNQDPLSDSLVSELRHAIALRYPDLAEKIRVIDFQIS
ncbi:binding--dependent transport system inner membrane component family protein [Chlamydia ibidis]|uniref:Binding--dependent transport system inner membrane component family protein n=2 Tax=Chlamydia ibidis TaxID=1405396 RepID=S7J304_9CHLA|nr:ABC transporter substrate-binding protein [Chlamydia ibidis]EPP34769.1 binding--dependent transport system inner membrane component family protein [Chlamydia ibidis]EQM62336.1 binding--dependent transport system inner membrane component family protein [Chlamydia ibidis 10-1398/6]